MNYTEGDILGLINSGFLWVILRIHDIKGSQLTDKVIDAIIEDNNDYVIYHCIGILIRDNHLNKCERLSSTVNDISVVFIYFISEYIGCIIRRVNSLKHRILLLSIINHFESNMKLVEHILGDTVMRDDIYVSYIYGDILNYIVLKMISTNDTLKEASHLVDNQQTIERLLTNTIRYGAPQQLIDTLQSYCPHYTCNIPLSKCPKNYESLFKDDV